jgi:hypothetical protein
LCLFNGLAPNTSTLAHTSLASEHLSSNITVYSTLQGGSKKRKLSEDGGDPGSAATNGNSNGTTGGQQQGQNRLVHVKQEPGDFYNHVVDDMNIWCDDSVN